MPEWRNGRRSRLKICHGLSMCGFKSHLRYQLILINLRSILNASVLAA